MDVLPGTTLPLYLDLGLTLGAHWQISGSNSYQLLIIWLEDHNSDTNCLHATISSVIAIGKWALHNSEAEF